MSKTTHDRPAGLRIWVALDESPRSTAALTAAAALAQELDAELAGLFVEDVNLQHLFGLPFAREFSVLTGAGPLLSQGDLERTWRRQAATLQRLLAEAAGRQRLRWSFRVARGRVSAEMSTLAQSFDLVVLGKQTGSKVVAITRTTPRLLDRPPQPREGPVMVLFEAMPDSASSLAMGVKLARRNGAELVMLVSAASEDGYRAACAAAQAALTERKAAGRCVWLPTLDGATLAQAVRREAAGCLVLADRERFLKQAGFERMVDEIECPVVLTR
jgi:nucleotide-binding universal stress UspA family protein